MDHDWNDVTTQKSGGRWFPAEPMIRMTARFIQRKTGIDNYEIKRKTKRALDIGCGNGNHAMFFANQGISAAGIDISENAVNIARKRAENHGLDADFETGNAEMLPWDDNTFDLVVSDGVLDHVRFAEAKRIIKEARRVSTPDAYLFLSLRSTADSECGRGQKVEENTYVLEEGYEEGMLQHFFDQKHITELLADYKIFDIEHIKREYPTEFTIDKSYLQSSEGMKTQVDVTDTTFDRQHSRWWLAAEHTGNQPDE